MGRVYKSSIGRSYRFHSRIVSVFSIIETVLVLALLGFVFIRTEVYKNLFSRIAELDITVNEAVLLALLILCVFLAVNFVVSIKKQNYNVLKIYSGIGVWLAVAYLLFILIDGYGSRNERLLLFTAVLILFSFNNITNGVAVTLIKRNSLKLKNLQNSFVALGEDGIYGKAITDISISDSCVDFHIRYDSIIGIRTVEFCPVRNEYFNLIVEHSWGCWYLCIDNPEEACEKISMCMAVYKAGDSIAKAKEEGLACCELCNKPVKAGELLCSECAEMFQFDSIDKVPYWCGMCANPGPFGNFCPKCGAKNTFM